MSTGETSKLLTIPEAAERLRLSRTTVYRLIWASELPAVQLGGPGSSLRIAESELEGWLRASRGSGPTGRRTR